MNRRSFLESTSKAKLRNVEVLPAVDDPGGISKFANKTLPKVARTTAGIEPYSGPWGFDQVAHLLRRTMFGATKSDIQSMLGLSMNQVVSQLLLDSSAPNPPVNTNSADIDVPIGQTWVNSPKLDSNGYNPDGGRRTSLKSWWIGLIRGGSGSCSDSRFPSANG